MQKPEPEIRVVLTTNGMDYAAVEVFIGKRSLCASVSDCPKNAYERVIKKLARIGRELWLETQGVQ